MGGYLIRSRYLSRHAKSPNNGFKETGRGGDGNQNTLQLPLGET